MGYYGRQREQASQTRAPRPVRAALTALPFYPPLSLTKGLEPFAGAFGACRWRCPAWRSPRFPTSIRFRSPVIRNSEITRRGTTRCGAASRQGTDPVSLPLTATTTFICRAIRRGQRVRQFNNPTWDAVEDMLGHLGGAVHSISVRNGGDRGVFTHFRRAIASCCRRMATTPRGFAERFLKPLAFPSTQTRQTFSTAAFPVMAGVRQSPSIHPGHLRHRRSGCS
jgi:hypothetical protein